jgi:ribose transport system substrate-binding protein
MGSGTPKRDSYLVKSIVHCSELLAAFESPGECLPLREIANRSKLPKSMAFRLLYTLEKCNMVEKVGRNLYRSDVHHIKQKTYKLGYAAQGTDYLFSREVSESVQRAAAMEGMKLIFVDNHYNPKISQKNADMLVREKVDIAIEFQTDQDVAPIVASKYRAANIPLIAIEIPHPGAIFYGANNYEAGLIGGRYLGQWAKRNWDSQVDEIILIELKRAGALPRMRLTGMLVGLKEILPNAEKIPVRFLDGDGLLGNSFNAVRKHLRTSTCRHVLVGGVNDPSALGALRAFQEAGRAECCAVMGQNASPEGRAELREPGTRLIGSVAYFPEHYGDDIIRLAIDILEHKQVPPAVFAKHKLLTPANVDHGYPNDRLTEITAGAWDWAPTENKKPRKPGRAEAK